MFSAPQALSSGSAHGLARNPDWPQVGRIETKGKPMKKILLSLAILLAIAPSTNARTMILKGDAADAFVSKHFPNADIPGPVEGPFVYLNRMGRRTKGFARCSVPAMGARSDGAVSTCTVKY
jgi:hypothetical protein